MPARKVPSLFWIGSALALVLVFAGCTPGGQFDPTEVLSSDIFNTKKRVVGEREPLFPNGVPGAETGVPADLVKGYQPPLEQQSADANAATAPGPQANPAAATAAAKPKPKPKPKPAVARAPATPAQPGSQPSSAHDPVWDRAPAPSAPAAQAPASAWPNSTPSPQAQTNWPAPPPTGQGQLTAQPAQSSWPAPSSAGTYSR
jgi:hypothetical protein